MVCDTIAVAQPHCVSVSLPCFQGDNTCGPRSPQARLEVWGKHIRPAKSKQMNLQEATMQRSKRYITQVKRGALDGELTITKMITLLGVRKKGQRHLGVVLRVE
jgi:hypothetical protein